MEFPTELDVATYAAFERQALETLSNDHIRSFSAATYAFHGYPAAAETDAAVARFVDTMQEMNNPHWHYQTELYSREEADLVQRVNLAVMATTKLAFGRSIRPWMGPLVAIQLFRAIQSIAAAAGRERLRIFEIGPGSGYLGALLAAQGHHYYSTDIAQGFYLWQSRLMRAVSSADFVEGARQERWPYDPAGRVIHMPWWHYATLYRDTPPAVDIVICDHALGEMNPYALRYIAQLSKNMLSDSPLGLVMFCSIGEPRFNSEEAVRLNFVRVGMNRIIEKNVSVFAMADREFDGDFLTLAEGIPVYDPSGSSVRLKGRDFVPIHRDEAPASYEFYEFLGYDVPTDVVSSVALVQSSKDDSGPRLGAAPTAASSHSINDDSERHFEASTPTVPRQPTKLERLCAVYGKTRQRGMGWLMHRLIRALSG